MTSTRQAHGAYTIIGHVQILAEKVDDLETGLPVLPQELQQVLPPHYRDLCIIESFRGDFVRAPRKDGTETQYLSRTGNTKSQLLPLFRTDGKAGTPFAQHVDRACALSFPEDAAAAGKGVNRLYGIKGLQGLRRQIAEQPVGAEIAIEAALVSCALHAAFLSLWGK